MVVPDADIELVLGRVERDVGDVSSEGGVPVPFLQVDLRPDEDVSGRGREESGGFTPGLVEGVEQIVDVDAKFEPLQSETGPEVVGEPEVGDRVGLDKERDVVGCGSSGRVQPIVFRIVRVLLSDVLNCERRPEPLSLERRADVP